MKITLEGKVALVTGAGSGIGAASAKTMASAGAAVMVSDMRFDAAREVAGAIRSAGGRAEAIALDVSDEAQIRDAIADTVARLGTIDILHNNAADVGSATMAADGDGLALESATWDHVLSVAARGTWLCSKYAIEHMLGQRGGAIINTASLAGLLGLDRLTAYSAAKAAVIQLTASIATQFGKDNIRCNAVAPGFVLTDAALAMFPPDKRETALRDTLTPYLGTPGDIAAAVCFLASDHARYITGQTLRVDGGSSVHAQNHGRGRSAAGSE